MAIHHVGMIGVETRIDSLAASSISKRHQNLDQMYARFYAEASNKPVEWWLKKMTQAGTELTILSAKKLRKLGMEKR
jgi:hypothetical protein